MMTGVLPISAFPAWAKLNGIEITNLELGDVPGKGLGLVASSDIAATDEGEVLLQIPRDLVLSREAVDNFTKVDGKFRQLLEHVGRKSARDDILLYLLVQKAFSSRGTSGGEGIVATPWTEYMRFLPQTIPVPSLWAAEHRALLDGTSLENATRAKVHALDSEFETLRDSSSQLTWWHDQLWENATVSPKDWYLVDAWYRSRCLEMPQAGVAMIPGLDMINHASAPNAIYEESSDGDVTLRMRPGQAATKGQEITISYGSDKPAAEMLFSYGFIDSQNATEKLTLSLDTPEDDPLGRAKQHVFDKPTIATISRDDSGMVEWTSPFVYLMCLNEEDGLDFRLLQETEGGRHLRVFWDDEDVTSKADSFEELIQGHPLEPIFRLRAVATLQQSAELRLEAMQMASPENHAREHAPTSDPSLQNECALAARTLRSIETRVLQAAHEAFETEKTSLLAHPRVAQYLGLMEEAQKDKVADDSTNEEPDFS